MKKNIIYVIHPINWFMNNKPFTCKFIANESAAKEILDKEISNDVCLAKIQVDTTVQPSGFIQPILTLCTKKEWWASKKEIEVIGNPRYMFYEIDVLRNPFCETLFPEEYEKIRKQKTVEILKNLQINRSVPA